MDIKKIEEAAKTEALGWIELTEDPVPISWAGFVRVLKRAALGFAPVAVAFAVFGVIKLLGWVPAPPV